MIFMACLYDDENPETYKGISLSMGRDAAKDVFNTGNPTVDYFTAYFVASKRCKDAGVDIDDVPLMGSSSIDHFVMDGGTLNTDDPTDDEVQGAVAAAKAYLGMTEETG
ncbi:hypothetical protein N9917_00325 [Deltaproteobacteria bacterium]|nr:hypothetical protein [Deltaproteobacteria bacterium]